MVRLVAASDAFHEVLDEPPGESTIRNLVALLNAMRAV
jgi:hypothetical protein